MQDKDNPRAYAAYSSNQDVYAIVIPHEKLFMEDLIEIFRIVCNHLDRAMIGCNDGNREVAVFTFDKPNPSYILQEF